jgi:[FeFe] hydrogenase H-cluster maturation GTPase HydF
LNRKPNSTRPHIAIVGRRNVGKSLLVNSLLGSEISLVSDIAGTTINPLSQSFELAPYGPVIIVDTVGIDDDGELGQEKISETIKIISSSDFVVIIIDARDTLHSKELELIVYLDKIRTNYIVAVNKIEFGINPELLDELRELRITHYEISCKEKAGIEELKHKITRLLPEDNDESLILDDIILNGDIIVIVESFDTTQSEGKLIPSHIQMIREALDENVTVIVCREKELRSVLDNLKSFPDLIIVDSYSFLYAISSIPDKIRITTFSMLLARYKGDLNVFVKGLAKINQLKNGDRVLIIEACLHHPKEEEMS